MLENTINYYEAFYRRQWNEFADDYKAKMAKGIVAFEITVNDLQAKKKISQNRIQTEKQKIIDTLSESGDTNEQISAQYMIKEGLVNK
ncbi:MAG TPA: hypothetical protein VGB71_16510 [Flavisolibacter sp.]